MTKLKPWYQVVTPRQDCGKIGLATGFLLQPLDRGSRGCFIPFPELVAELYTSLADHLERQVLHKYGSYVHRTKVETVRSGWAGE